ncbi:MAG: hypothetical protein IJS97_05170 [Prevotella sp.]|nr:hypothetical protein [Prevotella sp.]
MKRFTTILLLMVSAVICFAQSLDERKRQIAEIKKSGNYIYADETAMSEQEAFDRAEEKLYAHINAYIMKMKQSDEGIQPNEIFNVEKIEIPRANLFRAFLYVKNTEILSDPNASSEVEPEAAPDPQESALPEEPVQEEVGDPRAQALSAILGFETFAQMRAGLADMKQQGKVKSYAMYKDLAHPEEFILIIFDADGNIRTVLGEGKNRMNLKTNTADDIHNYKGLGAVGVKI